MVIYIETAWHATMFKHPLHWAHAINYAIKDASHVERK
jgi:hypothetical protein